MNKRIIAFLLALLSLTLLAGSSWANDGERFHLSATYQEECGSCHVPYPPQLLPSRSWEAIMLGLNQHFGSDASLDTAKAREIGAYLAAHAGRPGRIDSSSRKGDASLRISETPWFKQKHRDGHDGITANVWKSPAVRSAANCAACHRRAAEGNYSEEGIRIPRKM